MADLPYIIQWRRGTAQEWATVDPILAEAEAGVETDTLKVKIGDGTRCWSDLPYFTGGVVEEAPTDGRMYVRQNGAWVAITEMTSEELVTASGEIFKTVDSLIFTLKGV